MPEVETIFFGHWTQKAPIYSGYRENSIKVLQKRA